MVPSDNSKSTARAVLWLTGLAWTLPFLLPWHRFPLTSFYSEWLAFALGLAACAVLLKREYWREAALPVIALSPLALALLLALHGYLGRAPYPEQAALACLYLLWAAMLVVLGYALRRRLELPALAGTLAWWLLAGGLLTAAAGILQHFQWSSPLDALIARRAGAQVYGNLGQPNHAAAYLSLALASTGYLHAAGRLRRAPAALCAALLLLVLALTGSRSGWVYLGWLAAMALGLHAMRRDAASRRLALFAGCLIPAFVLAHAVAALPVVAPAQGEAPAARLFDLASGIAARAQLAREGWTLFMAAPVAGAGWGAFAWHHFAAQAASGDTAAPGVYNHAHNIAIQLMAETGLLGAALLVGACALWICGARRDAREIEGWWLLALLGVIALHSFLEYPLWYSFFLGIAAWLAGAGARHALPLRSPPVGRVVFAAALAAGVFHVASILPAYRAFERLVFTPGVSGKPMSEPSFAQALAGLYREPLLVPYVELAIAYGVRVDADQLPEKLALVERAARFAPVAVVSYRYALLLAMAGRRNEALAQLDRALRVYPADAPGVAAELDPLARRHPEVFRPLLERVVASTAGAG